MNDLKFAFRQLAKNSGFTAVAALTLGFGIGVNTSMFGALRELLARRLTFPQSDRLVQVFRTLPHSQRWPHSPANFLDQQTQNVVFEHMAALNPVAYNFAEPGQPTERVNGMQASAELFPLLGVRF